MNRMTHILRRALAAVYPQLCEVCGTTLVASERLLCLGCLTTMPRTYSHRDPDARVLGRLARVCPVGKTASWFHYDPGGKYSALIRAAKYESRPTMARAMGEIFARELLADDFFNDIDLLVPIPLHWRRRYARGFNQSCEIARGVSLICGISISNNLRAVRAHASQTGFSRTQRLNNVHGVFALRNAEAFAGKHILIIDDIFTTGATIESAAKTLMSVDVHLRPAKISVLTLGLTRDHVR